MVDPHDVGQFQRRFAEEMLAAVLRQAQQGALDGGHRLRADQAVLGGNVLALLGHQAEQGAQVVHVQQEQAAVIGQLEHDVEHAGLGVVQFQDACQQGRAHLAHGGAHRVAELAVQIPEHGGAGRRGVVAHADLGRALEQVLGAGTRHRQTRHIALHIGQEHRYPDPRETLGQGHQGHGLAGAGSAGHQPMAVAEFRQQGDSHIVGDAFAEQNRIHGPALVMNVPMLTADSDGPKVGLPRPWPRRYSACLFHTQCHQCPFLS
ncbi:hypothetical protein D3C81_462360 [compost metagenome]